MTTPTTALLAAYEKFTTTLLEHPQLKHLGYWQGIIRVNQDRLAAGTLALQQEFWQSQQRMLQELHAEIPLPKLLPKLPLVDGQLSRLALTERIIAVVGTVKAGKSTTINALIGQELLPNRNQPMTTLPTLLRHVPEQKEPRLTLRPVAALQTLAESCRAALASTHQRPLVAQEADGQRLVAALQSGSWQVRGEYLGQTAIFAFLKDFNDLLRLALELHLPLETTLAAFQQLADLPIIEVTFANRGPEKIALLDTPGPNESGQNEVLRGWLRHYLQQVDQLLVVTDYSQLKSEAHDEITQLVLEQLGTAAVDRVAVAVNKFDQRDRHGMDAAELRQFIAAGLPIAPTQIFPVSARLALWAQLAQALENLQTPPPWFPAFAEEAFGRRWQQEAQDPQAVAEAAAALWTESGFPEVMAAIPQWLANSQQQNAVAEALIAHLADATNHLHWQSGQYFQAQGQSQAAQNAYAAAQDFPWAQLSYAKLLQHNAETAGAIRLYQTLNQPQSGEVQALAQLALGNLYEQQARFAESLAAYQAAAANGQAVAAAVRRLEDRLAWEAAQKQADLSAYRCYLDRPDPAFAQEAVAAQATLIVNTLTADPTKTGFANLLPFLSEAVRKASLEQLFSRIDTTKNQASLGLLAQIIGLFGEFALPRLLLLLDHAKPHWRYTAARALGNIGDARAVEPLIARLADKDSDVRRSATEALGKIGDARAVEPLISRLADKNIYVRQFATYALGNIGDARAVEPLIARLADADWKVRQSASEALRKIGELAMLPLIAHLADKDSVVQRAAAESLKGLIPENLRTALINLADADSVVRHVAAKALGNIGDARAVEPLIARLADADSDVRVRRSAAKALGNIGDARAVEPLIAHLADKDSDVRQAATEALGKIGELAVLPLITCLADEDSNVRRAAAESLKGLIPENLRTALINLADADSNVRHVAAKALGNIGDARAVEPLIARLADADSDVRQSAAEALGEIGELAVLPLIARLADKNIYVRQSAAYALGNIGDARAVEPLIACLADADSVVRRAAAESLKGIIPENLRTALINLVDANNNVRRAAAETLGKIGDARAVEPLIARLKDEDKDVRRVAGKSLKGLIPEKLRTALINLLADAGWQRQFAARALGNIGDARAVELLIARLVDANSNVQRTIAEALGKIGDARAVEPLIARLADKYEDSNVRRAAGKSLKGLIPENLRTALINLADKDSDVREFAAETLGNIGDTRAVEPLITCLADNDWGVRRATAKALGNIGDARAVEPLIARLAVTDSDVQRAQYAHNKSLKGLPKDLRTVLSKMHLGDSDVRESAAKALGKIGDARAVEPLIARLADADSDVRESAAEALGKIGELAVLPLITCLADTDSDMRSAAAEALGKIGELAVLPLITYLADNDWGVRLATANALGKIGDARAVEPLIAHLADADWQVRRNAVHALGDIGDVRTVETLITRLADADWPVRRAAAEALGNIGDARAVETLIARLADGDWQVRRVAAKALVKIGDTRALDLLIARLANWDSDVRLITAKALGKIGDDRAVKPLTARLADKDICVRGAAAESLAKINKRY